ncbi:dihydroxyacetone kinase subunit DhaK [Sansalvadorimonas sp. 2012CJ34-2]|uniref:Dihydroxyacetone kinase subunit DhaK n=1 Tax=Parendozoicomonas callyspongiae TaxID=2942213 RepID=A0ABT0PDY8_9GAMM|nr:dihydroxyacetone kinase subunit DhaK [Sansalvadorimonas sp. 2012CJ34-2]MCL6269261.1 dihydroxyacetone kinase subunit DhaK [Sansalvadorimonas sp. 2012CJ34-2]
MTMKKLINNPENLTVELLEGMALGFPEKVKIVSEKIVCRANPKPENKVRIVTLGGAGHEPALSGFVGEGMLDFSVVGDIFAAPGAPKVFEALKMANCDAGVLFIVLNHEGDVMSANMAMEMAKREGLNVKMLLTHEDISAGLDAEVKDRRGLVGCVPVYKIAGAAAEAGLSLDEVYEVAERMHSNMATLAAALKTATHPQSGLEIAELADDEMEIGMGQHGEGGGGRCKILTANEAAEIMLDNLCKAIHVEAGDELMLLLNGVGATTLMELFLVNRACHVALRERGATVACSAIDEYLTVQEMAGFQMCLARVDAQMKALWKAPSNAPYWVTR